MAARSKSSQEPEPEAQDEERVVDPPAATEDPGASLDHQWVLIDQSGMLTLPSGASYAFNAGNVLPLSSEDAAYVVSHGYGSETDDPSGE